MKEKINAKKLLKLAGNVLMVAALVFVGKKLLDMDVSLSDFSSGRVVGALITGTIVQTLIICAACIPWMIYIRSLSGIGVPYSAAMPVYTQSNIYKYIPGNVFQYVGRNKLAADRHISHVDVACATVMEIIICAFWAGVVSLILLGGEIAGLIGKYGKNIFIVGIVGVTAVIALIVLVRLKFRSKFSEYVSRYSKAFEKENRPRFICGILYYLLHNSVFALLYFICLRLIIPQATIPELVTLAGAFTFAWIVGFVTPGAPGGIGIREGVMIFVSGDKYPDRVLLFVLVMRIGSIIADILAFSAGRIYHRVSMKKTNEAS